VGNNRAAIAKEKENKTAQMDKTGNPEWDILPTQEWL
jgi:hypothetical protein